MVMQTSRPPQSESSDTPHVKLARVEHRLADLGRRYALPKYVKSAGIAETFLAEDLRPTQYADPLSRQYPCHTKAATWCSVVDFLEKKAELQHDQRAVLGRALFKLAGFWGITRDIARLLPQQTAPQIKQAEAEDSDYLFVNETLAIREMPMRTAVDVVKAAAWLKANANRFDFDARHDMASRIVAAGEKHAAALGDHNTFLDQQTGRGFCTPKQAADMFRDRAGFIKQPQLRQQAEKLAASIESSPQTAMTPDHMLDLARIADSLDRTAGINYARDQVQPPEQILFGTTYKEARAAHDGACHTTSGSVYHKADFEKLSLADVKRVLGSDFAAGVNTGMSLDAEKMAELLATAPRDDAEQFDRLMRDRGIQPALKQGAAKRRVGFSERQLMALASSPD